jgi:hypothetical protein
VYAHAVVLRQPTVDMVHYEDGRRLILLVAGIGRGFALTVGAAQEKAA